MFFLLSFNFREFSFWFFRVYVGGLVLFFEGFIVKRRHFPFNIFFDLVYFLLQWLHFLGLNFDNFTNKYQFLGFVSHLMMQNLIDFFHMLHDLCLFFSLIINWCFSYLVPFIDFLEVCEVILTLDVIVPLREECL